MGWNRDSLRSGFRGCLAGTACGDGIGLPWEMMAHADIMKATNDAGVTGLAEIPRSHPVWQVGEHPIGSTSDDWALTAATARSFALIGTQRVPDRRASMIIGRERQIALLQTGGAGWGSGTVAGTHEIGRWLDGHADGRAPWVEVPVVTDTGIGRGAGCGPAMQISPIGLLAGVAGLDQVRLDRWSRLTAYMTHGNVEATVAAHAMALVVSYALRLGAGDRPVASWKSSEIPRRLIDRVVTELRRETDYPKESLVIAALRRLSEPGFLDGPDRLREEIRNGFLCWESVPFAIGTWLRHKDDPRLAILEAATAGGDTDSTAAMAGALAGAYAGIDAVPAEWRAQIPNATVAIALADRLFDPVALGEFNP